VNPDLVVRDENGDVYTVRYDAVNAMLLNEFLKEHRKVERLEKQVIRYPPNFFWNFARQISEKIMNRKMRNGNNK
jgi:hypothetical protein